MRFAHVKTTILALATALAAGFAASSSSKAAPEAVAECPLNFTALKVSNLTTGIVLRTFVDVPESDVRFVQGGTKISCIVVSFSGESAAGPNEAVRVRALLDGRPACHPGESFFGISTTPGGRFAVGTVNHVCTGVTPGPHTIKLQFSSRNGTGVELHHRTVTVHHFR